MKFIIIIIQKFTSASAKTLSNTSKTENVWKFNNSLIPNWIQ